MKYQCEVIKDLMPLYVDDVCSKESKKIIEEHLEICDSCKQYYDAMKSSDNSIVSEDKNNEILADSLQKVKKQIKIKKILAVSSTLIITFAFLCISAVAIIGLQHMDYIIPYSDDITLTDETPKEWKEWYSDRDNQLIIRAEGKQIVGMISELVEIEEEGKTEKILFFNVTTTPWHDIVTSDDDISYQFLSNVEVDKVYYYPGYIMDVEAIGDGELPILIETSTLMWENIN